MSDINFGEYFRKLRISKNKTQEDIANSIGKHKMLISGIEHGKNNPPKESDLRKIAVELNLNEDEKFVLFEMAAFQRGTLPNEIVKYIIGNAMVLELVKKVKDREFDDEQMKMVIKFCEDGLNTK